ncbi:uncharacterized protein LOC116596341 [Mustela erminea]|uniref:uncharacterized protein LOC116596341 n=1 Tax=Mustela erminea TaxID=36723 RepID=UPI001386B318|nr:uncharacterized protein LOC116596341 [Mustela erminea]
MRAAARLLTPGARNDLNLRKTLAPGTWIGLLTHWRSRSWCRQGTEPPAQLQRRRAPGPVVHGIPRCSLVLGQPPTCARFPRRREDSAERRSKLRPQTRLQVRRQRRGARPGKSGLCGPGWRQPWSRQFPDPKGEGASSPVPEDCVTVSAVAVSRSSRHRAASLLGAPASAGTAPLASFPAQGCRRTGLRRDSSGLPRISPRSQELLRGLCSQCSSQANWTLSGAQAIRTATSRNPHSESVLGFTEIQLGPYVRLDMEEHEQGRALAGGAEGERESRES